MDETAIKSIDTSRPSDFRFQAVIAEKTIQEITAVKVVETIEVKEEPKISIDPDSDDSRAVSIEPKETYEIVDDLSDIFQPDGMHCIIRCYFRMNILIEFLRIRRTNRF